MGGDDLALWAAGKRRVAIDTVRIRLHRDMVDHRANGIDAGDAAVVELHGWPGWLAVYGETPVLRSRGA